MASVTPKSNGTYLIRVSCGLDSSGKQISRSKIFKPSKPNLSYQKLNKEIDAFIADFELEARSESAIIRPDKVTFAEFVEKYLEVKKSVLSPNTYVFYERIIRSELIPMFGAMKLREIRTYHVQQFIQYLTNEKKRDDGVEGGIVASTVRRYTTVLRSILTLAYKLEYTDDDVGSSRRIEFPKEASAEVEVFTIEEVQQIMEALESEPLYVNRISQIMMRIYSNT